MQSVAVVRVDEEAIDEPVTARLYFSKKLGEAAAATISQSLRDLGFELDVVLTEEEAVWQHQPGKRWRRRGWCTVERRLLSVRETVSLRSPADYMSMIPAELSAEFATSDIARALACTRRLAQQMAYCLKNGGLIERTGARGKAIVYSRV